jgi:hypothetical protein
VLQIIAMKKETVEVSGRKLYNLEILYRGQVMPVTVYLVKDGAGKVFNLCVCFEHTPIETQIAIDITDEGKWIDIYDGKSELAEAIGMLIEKKIDQHAKLN